MPFFKKPCKFLTSQNFFIFGILKDYWTIAVQYIVQNLNIYHRTRYRAMFFKNWHFECLSNSNATRYKTRTMARDSVVNIPRDTNGHADLFI
jgi:hypothetical protein